MAKGQKRSSREVKKPKATKPTATVVQSISLKGTTEPVSPKKKR
jgi:hypothetical protein